MGSSQGHAIFAGRLVRFAADVDQPRVGAIARRTARAVTVAVHGRSGVGRGTVARALAATGVVVSGAGDVDVHVLAEVVKPEDRAAIRASASRRPTLAVLNKADLAPDARVRCDRYRALTGVPTVPMVAHLAVATIDETALSALRTLAAEPADLGSVDDFVTKSHPLPGAARVRLLEELDLSGVALARLALRSGTETDAAGVQRLLRRRSGVDAVVSALDAMIAEAGYRRVRSAVAGLREIAVTEDVVAARIDEFLRDDDTLLACMAAAVDVVEASGMTVDPADEPSAHLSRAAVWHRYRRGPVNDLHRACGDDIVRGSMRLWRHARSGAVR